MLSFYGYGSFQWLTPLFFQGNVWTAQDFDWIALGIGALLALLIGCVVVAACVALICSVAVLLRSLFTLLLPRQPLQPLLGVTAPVRASGKVNPRRS